MIYMQLVLMNPNLVSDTKTSMCCYRCPNSDAHRVYNVGDDPYKAEAGSDKSGASLYLMKK